MLPISMKAKPITYFIHISRQQIIIILLENKNKILRYYKHSTVLFTTLSEKNLSVINVILISLRQKKLNYVDKSIQMQFDVLQHAVIFVSMLSAAVRAIHSCYTLPIVIVNYIAKMSGQVTVMYSSVIRVVPMNIIRHDTT